MSGGVWGGKNGAGIQREFFPSHLTVCTCIPFLSFHSLVSFSGITLSPRGQRRGQFRPSRRYSLRSVCILSQQWLLYPPQ